MSNERSSYELDGHAYLGLLAGVANHEAKAFTLAYMATRPEDHYFVMEELGDGVITAQGPQPAWRLHKSVPFAYCHESFEPIGAVAKSRLNANNGRLITAYGLTAFGRQDGLAMAGLCMRWSLDHPEVSVQEILGTTQSQTENRSPAIRMAIIHSMLAADTDGLSYEGIALDNPGIPGIRLNIENLRTGKAAKLLDIVTNQVAFNPLLAIGDPEYHGRKPYETLAPERRAIYEALRTLKLEQGVGMVALGELVEAAHADSPESDPKNIRAILVQGIRPGSKGGLSPLTVAENGRGALGTEKSSRIKIRAEYTDALEELANDLEAFQSGYGQKQLRDTALSVVTEESESRQLMQKAYDYSPKARVAHGPVRVGKAVIEILKTESAGVSVAEIRSRLARDYNLAVTETAVRNNLGRIASASDLGGSVESEQRATVQQGRSQKRTYYRFKPSKG